MGANQNILGLNPGGILRYFSYYNSNFMSLSPALSIFLFYGSFLAFVLDVSTEAIFELNCISFNVYIDILEIPPKQIIDCSIANGTIAEIFCMFDSVTASDVITVTEY